MSQMHGLKHQDHDILSQKHTFEQQEIKNPNSMNSDDDS